MKNLRVISIVVFLFCGKSWALPNPIYLGFEQRIMLSYLIQSAGETHEAREVLARRAASLMRGMQSRGIDRIKVASFEEFLTLWRGTWPNTHKLDLDLQLLEANSTLRLRYFSSDNQELQERIEGYYREQEALFVAFLIKHKVPRNNALIKNVFGQIKDYEGSFDSVREEAEVKMTKVVFDGTSPILLSYMNEVEKVASEIASDSNNFGSEKGIQRVIQLFVGGYFKELNLEAKKQAFSLLLELPFQATTLERFGAIIGATGPQLQKLLQILAREKDMNPKLREVFRGLEANVRPVPWVLVNQILESEKANYELIEVEKSPLGVGTMAQVHQGKLKHNGQVEEVVVRFLKPGIEERVAEDRDILRKLAPMIDADALVRADNLPRVVPIVDDLSRTISEELVFKNTIERQKLAINVYHGTNKKLFKNYNRTLYLSVPIVFEPNDPASKLLVQEFVSGKKLDEIAKIVAPEMPNFKTLVVEELARVWIREVLLGTGFYHSDLHQGNFKISVGQHEVHLNILDFGMSGVLSKNLRLNFMKLGAGVDLLKDEAIASAFWDLSEKEKNNIGERAFRDTIFDEVNKIKSGTNKNKRFHEWISYAMELGVSLPYDFINLNRGYVILTKLLEETSSGYNMSILAKRAGMKKPVTVATLLLQAGDISLFDMVKIAVRGLFKSKTNPIDDIQVENTPVEKVSSASQIRCEQLFMGGY